jgi:hypothetical protein
MIRLRLLIILICFMSAAVGAQVNEWPYDLQKPETAEQSDVDTTIVDFISQQSLYMNTVLSLDSLRIFHDDSARSLRQSGYYRIEKNELFGSRKQYFDLSGAVLKKRFLLPGVSMGIDWTPILLLNSSAINHALSGSLDMGPMIQSNSFLFPLTLRGGFAGKVQNDNFSLNGLRETVLGNARRDKGLYFAFDAGSADSQLYSLPLYFNVKGYGRSQVTSKLFTTIGSALFTRDFFTGDTLSLLYSDSLINGSGAVLGDEGAQGKSFFLDIPQSIIRSYQLKGGIHGKYRFHLQPALVYSFARHSLQYPSANDPLHPHNELSDRQNTVSSFNAMLASDPAFHITYSGGIRIDLEKEEKLFQEGVNSDRIKDTSNADTLRVKLNDYDGYRAMMKHIISLHNAQGAGIEYSFDISRYLKTYPFHYLQRNKIPITTNPAIIDTFLKTDTISSNDDKDWIVQNHNVKITSIINPKWRLSLVGEYSNNLSYNLKKEKSANNSIDYFYLLGLNSDFDFSEKVKIEEALSTDVKRTEYVFPEEYHKMGFLPPSYSREVTIRSVATWSPGKKQTIRAEWGEHYEDDGYWFDKASIDSTGPNFDSLKAAFKPYYGIERTQWRHSCALKDSFAISRNISSEIGGSLEYVFQKKFNDVLHLYIADPSQTRYIVVPFLSVDSKLNQYFTLRARIKRNIDTVKDDYWDFRILFSARF